MNILVVGAGAVGQVYARYLGEAGHAITFFVKARHAAALADGLALHKLGHLRRQSEVWRDYAVVSDIADIAAGQWDQVWLCMASDALRSPLSQQVLAAVGAAAVVCLQPGPEDADWVRQQLPATATLVQGLITFISYQSPLPEREGPEGMAYFVSPLAPGLFSGPRAAVQRVVEALKAGGMSAREVADLGGAGAGAEAVMIPLIAALEQHNWKLGGFGGSAQLALGRAAGEEALAVLARDRGAKVALERLILNPLASRALLMLAPRVLPLELEPYLEYHFTKVGRQTRDMLDSYIRLGYQHGLPTTQLEALRGGLDG
ncbi:MAG: 2-dehydropantoate 2-reductase N-terminal domain-containing protein [Moraxellaceae bacterium]|nr:2-dehydropantoate 2-reductase N-terminal domain-containing protein [Moraxellaceae bacterium]